MIPPELQRPESGTLPAFSGARASPWLDPAGGGGGGGGGPHICQLVALSESTGYRFADWMRMAGFELRNIPRLQVELHFERTVAITPTEFRSTFHSSPAASDQLLIDQPLSRAHPLSRSRQDSREADVRGEDLRRDDASRREPYSLVKIGSDDAAFSPQLVAGMIVRVDRRYRRLIDLAMTNLVSPRDLLWLVDRPGGLTCCQVEWAGDDQIILWPARPPLGSLPLRCRPKPGFSDWQFWTVFPRGQAAKRLEPA